MKLSREVLVLIAILMLGALLRGIYLSELTERPDFAQPSVDALYHDYWARGIVTGDWSVQPPHEDPQIRTTPYFRPPGYTWFMAGVYAVTGGSYLGLRIAQMLLGLVSVLIAYLLGSRFLGKRTGLILAGLMSVYWVFIYFEGELLEPVLLVVLGMWLVYDISRWTERVSVGRAILSGVIMGLFALTRPNVLLFAPAVVVWAYWVGRRRQNTRGYTWAIAGLALGCIVTISPATIRNYAVSREFVPISSNTGINLYIGNNEFANAQCVGYIPGLGSFETCFDYPQIVRNLEKETGRKLKHTEVSVHFTRKAVGYIKAEPAKVLGLTWQKALMFWCPLEIGHNKEDELERADSGLLRRIPVGFPVVLAMSMVGLAAMAWETRRRRTAKESAPDRRLEVSVLIILFIAMYFLSYVPFFAAGRYRVPIVPFLMFFGAYGVDYILALVAARRAAAALCWVLALGGAYGLSMMNPTGYKPDAAKWHYDRAVDLSAMDQTQRAIEEYTEALRIRPVFPQAHCNLGMLLMADNKIDEAVEHIEKAIEIDPREALPYYALGQALMLQGRTDAAIEKFRKAVELDPHDPQARNDLGMALVSDDKMAEARAEFEKALEINPDFAPAHNSLGVLAEAEGRIDQAVEHFSKALRIAPTAALHYKMGGIRAHQQKLDEAIEHYHSAIALKSDYPQAHYDLGVALSVKGQLDEAIEHYSEAARIAPDYGKAHKNLAVALYFKGDYARAREEANLAAKHGAAPDAEFMKALAEAEK